jgi:hypothetical protein
MAEVIKKVINDHGLGCWWGGVDMGFWYLRSRWTPSVGMSVSSVSHAILCRGSCALVTADMPWRCIYTHYKLFHTVIMYTPWMMVYSMCCYVGVEQFVVCVYTFPSHIGL